MRKLNVLMSLIVVLVAAPHVDSMMMPMGGMQGMPSGGMSEMHMGGMPMMGGMQGMPGMQMGGMPGMQMGGMPMMGGMQGMPGMQMGGMPYGQPQSMMPQSMMMGAPTPAQGVPVGTASGGSNSIIQKATKIVQSHASNPNDAIENLMNADPDEAIVCLIQLQDGKISRRHTAAHLEGIVTDQTDINNYKTKFFAAQAGASFTYQVSDPVPNGQPIQTNYKAQILINNGGKVCFVRTAG
jgi:hypothetical protein